MAKIKQLKEQAEEEIEIGDQVKHPKFGVGTVLYKSGSGDRAKATVVFPEEGQKKLALKHARLKRIKESKPNSEKEPSFSDEELIAAIEGPAKPSRSRDTTDKPRRASKSSKKENMGFSDDEDMEEELEEDEELEFDETLENIEAEEEEEPEE